MEQMAINAEGMAVNEKMCRDFRIFHLRNYCRTLRILSDNAWTCWPVALWLTRYKRFVHGDHISMPSGMRQ